MRTIVAILALLILAGCGEQKYSVWKVGGRPAERVAVEKGLDRAACELVLQRLERKKKEQDDLSYKIAMDAARLGIKSSWEPEIVRYSCEPE
jgi:hypothetical protein